MDHLRIMGFLLLLFTTMSAVQFAEARVLEHHFHNAALSQHNSLDLDTVAVASSRANYSGAGEHVTNYSESNTGSSSGNSTHAANNTIITVQLSQKDAAPGDGSSSKAPAGIKEAAPIEGNEDILHEILNSQSSPGVGHMSVNGGMEGNILSSSGQSPGVGHLEKSETKWKNSPSPARTTPNNVLSSGPSPGVGNGHTSAISGTQSELGTFNKLPSGPSPGVGHKVTNGYTEMVQESESKKSAMIMNILPSGPSPGVGNSATNGRNTMEKISEESEPKKKTAFNQDFESKKESAVIMNVLPSGPSPGVGNSATNGRNIMEKISIEAESKKKIAFNQESESKKKSTIMNILPSGPSPGVGHSATNGRNMIEKISIVAESKKKIAFTQESESKKKSTIVNILPSGPSPAVGNSATNGRNTMEKGTKDEEGMGIQTFNRLPSGSSPGVGHSYTNAHLPDKIQTASASEDTMGSDHNPMFHKLPGGPSPGGGHSYVEKSASTVTMHLSSNARRKASSSPSPGNGNSSMNKLKVARSQKIMVEQTGGALDQKIGCDGGDLDFYGTPTPPMFGIAAARS